MGGPIVLLVFTATWMSLLWVSLVLGMHRRRALRRELVTAGTAWASVLGLPLSGGVPRMFDANVARGRGFSPSPRLLVFDEHTFVLVTIGLFRRTEQVWTTSNPPTLSRRRSLLSVIEVDGKRVVVDKSYLFDFLRGAGWLPET